MWKLVHTFEADLARFLSYPFFFLLQAFVQLQLNYNYLCYLLFILFCSNCPILQSSFLFSFIKETDFHLKYSPLSPCFVVFSKFLSYALPFVFMEKADGVKIFLLSFLFIVIIFPVALIKESKAINTRRWSLYTIN